MSDGIGAYLMDAAQTFGDNLIGIFDRIGQLATGVVVSAAGAMDNAITAAMPTVAVAGTATATANANVTTGISQPGQGASSVINLPADAVSSLQAIKENPVSLNWQQADPDQTLGNLSKPLIPGMDVPALDAGMALA